MGYVRALSVRDLEPGAMRRVDVNSHKILVVNLKGKYYAIGDICMHRGCSLSNGTISGENVECPCHGSTYNIVTGSVVTGPTQKPEPTFQVKAEGDLIMVSI